MRDRVAALRARYPSLELLPSLDDLRERITLHLSAAQPGQVPPLVSEPRGRRGRPSAGEPADRADRADRAPRPARTSTCS